MMRIIQILGDRKAGFVIAMAVVLSLIVGSTVMNFYPEIYPPFFRFDIGYFFDPVRPLHWWFYLLLLSVGAMGGSVFFSTLESIMGLPRLLRSTGAGSPAGRGRIYRACAAILVHLGLVAALFAHLGDGLYGEIERVQVAGASSVSGDWTNLPGIGRVRIDSAREIQYPDGSRKDLVIRATFVTGGSAPEEREFSYNEPATFAWGARELLIQDGRNFGVSVLLKDDSGGEYRLPIDRRVKVRGGTVEFSGIIDAARGMKVAQFMVRRGADSGEPEKVYIMVNGGEGRYSSFELGGSRYRIHDTEYAFVLTGLLVYNPSVLLIVLAVALALAGMIFMTRIRG